MATDVGKRVFEQASNRSNPRILKRRTHPLPPFVVPDSIKKPCNVVEPSAEVTGDNDEELHRTTSEVSPPGVPDCIKKSCNVVKSSAEVFSDNDGKILRTTSKVPKKPNNEFRLTLRSAKKSVKPNDMFKVSTENRNKNRTKSKTKKITKGDHIVKVKMNRDGSVITDSDITLQMEGQNNSTKVIKSNTTNGVTVNMTSDGSARVEGEATVIIIHDDDEEEELENIKIDKPPFKKNYRSTVNSIGKKRKKKSKPAIRSLLKNRKVVADIPLAEADEENVLVVVCDDEENNVAKEKDEGITNGSINHTESEIRCHFCDWPCSSQEILSEHVWKTHIKDGAVRCTLCPFYSYFEASLAKHERVCHRIYRCRYCSFVATEERELYKHFKTDHSDKRYYALRPRGDPLPDNPSNDDDPPPKKVPKRNVDPPPKKAKRNNNRPRKNLHPRWKGRPRRKIRPPRNDLHHTKRDSSRPNHSKSSDSDKIKKSLHLHYQLCSICDPKIPNSVDENKDLSSQQDQDNSVKNGSNLFTCYECTYNTLCPFDLENHEKKHRTDLYKCPLCDYQTTIHEEYVKRHIFANHNELSIEEVMISDFRIRRLGVPCEPKTIVRCPFCPFFTSTNIALNQHTKAIHPVVLEDNSCDVTEECSTVTDQPIGTEECSTEADHLDDSCADAEEYSTETDNPCADTEKSPTVMGEEQNSKIYSCPYEDFKTKNIDDFCTHLSALHRGKVAFVKVDKICQCPTSDFAVAKEPRFIYKSLVPKKNKDDEQEDGPRTEGLDRERRFHLAARTGSVLMMQRCIAEGVDVNHKDVHDRTALHYAARCNHLDIVDFLLSMRSDIESCDNVKARPLHFAARTGHIKIVKLLIMHGAVVDPEDMHGNTPLLCAAKKGYNSVVETLLLKGANVEHENLKGMNALKLASQFKRHNTIELLCSYNASHNKLLIT